MIEKHDTLYSSQFCYMWIVVRWRDTESVTVSSVYGIENVKKARSLSISISLKGPYFQEVLLPGYSWCTRTYALKLVVKVETSTLADKSPASHKITKSIIFIVQPGFLQEGFTWIICDTLATKHSSSLRQRFHDPRPNPRSQVPGSNCLSFLTEVVEIHM